MEIWAQGATVARATDIAACAKRIHPDHVDAHAVVSSRDLVVVCADEACIEHTDAICVHEGTPFHYARPTATARASLATIGRTQSPTALCGQETGASPCVLTGVAVPPKTEPKPSSQLLALGPALHRRPLLLGRQCHRRRRSDLVRRWTQP
jgi:hypothetical protein